MFFEVNITPKAKTAPVHEDPETEFELLLAPFQPQTHIRIETALNTTASCSVILKNRSGRFLSVQVTKTPPLERLVQLSLERLKVNSQEDVELVISWTARKPGTFRDIIQLTDSRRIKYDLALTTSTTGLKKNEVRGGKSQVSEPKKVLTQNVSPNIVKKPENVVPRYEGKENVANWQTPKKSRQDKVDIRDFSMLIGSDTFALTPPPWFKGEENSRLSRTSQELRRETYVTAPNVTFSNEDAREGFEDSLSPKANQNCDFSNLIDDLKFTPAGVIHEVKTPSSTNNDTFEVIKSAEIETQRIIPTRLSRNFATISPVMPVVDQSDKFTSSSPICGNEGFNLQKRNPGVSSVQEVLEADLWAKPVGQFAFRSGATSLESIREEIVKTTPITNKTYVKSMNKTQTRFDTTNDSQIGIQAKKTLPIRKISPKKCSKVTKDRSILEIQGLKKKASMNASLKSGGRVSIPGVRITKLSLSGVSRPRKLARGFENEAVTKLHDPDDFFSIFCNPDPFAATTTEDPFLSSILYYDDKWVANQEIEFKKWLNALLTPPEHLTSNVDAPVADVAKIWQSCRMKEDVSLAETKEAVSARYHTNHRLNSLRRSACALLRSDDIVSVLSRVTVCIEKGILVIRQDRDLHKDIGLQKLVLELLLCYNPLWLRVGLEAIYGETIPLNSNNDIIRLSKFLISRFFSDPYIVKTHSHQTVHNLRLPTFLGVMNKFMLKKFLFVVYFLDYAKTNKLIGHDPCLFHKQAPHKESKRILLKFSQELLSGVGDVTKVLKPYGYILNHKQTEIDEYSYAVNNLSQDLRDGVRLCRVMELITGKKNLTSICRVPAISRLQKVYNVDVALKALTSSDYVICGNITAKCIADGHREKTLSLLWQIIYKFQAPLFNKAASALQRWWRSRLWWVRVKNFLLKRKNDAAGVIQRAWRSYQAKKELQCLRERREMIFKAKNQAARVIQLKWKGRKKMMMEKQEFRCLKSATLIVQRAWRNRRATKPFVASFRQKQASARVIQERWRATRAMKLQSSLYSVQREAIVRIQTWWRQKMVQKKARDDYLAVRRAAVFVQRKWQSNRLAKTQRQEYMTKIKAARTIQNWWRRELTYRRDRNQFLITKDAVRSIEKWWQVYSARSKLAKQENDAAIILQRKWRAVKTGREQRRGFVEKRNAAIIIQYHWRNWRIGFERRQAFISLKAAVVCVQERFRANKSALQASREFNRLKQSVVFVQRRWRAKISGRKARLEFISKREAAVVIQRRYRTIVAVRNYQRMRESLRKIQSWWRACVIAKESKSRYDRFKSAAVFVQRKYRAKKLGVAVRNEIEVLKKNVVYVQRKWRATKLMKPYREEFIAKRKAAIEIQSWWRACVLAKEDKSRYDLLKSKTILVQRKYRARKTGEAVREDFLRLKLSVVRIQQKWRAHRSRKQCRDDYLATREAAIKIQSWWRACRLCEEAKKYYEELRSSTILIQRKYRARKSGEIIKREFDTLKTNVVFIQRKWRSTKAANHIREDFISKREAAVKIQAWWRALVIGKTTRSRYGVLKTATIRIQQNYRARKLGAAIKREFDDLRNRIVWVQRRWRANKAMRLCCEDYKAKRRAILKIQIWWRAVVEGRTWRVNYLRQQIAAIQIQRWYRDVTTTRRLREFYNLRITSVTSIQNWWRDILARRKEIKQRKAAAATTIQAVWKGHKTRQAQSEHMTKLRERAEKAAMDALPSETLGHRLNVAIVIVQEYENLGKLTQGLTALDTITHLLPLGCITLCRAGLVPKLYDLIHRSNRSRPWMDICLRASSILVSITKYSPTKSYAWQEQYIEALIRLLSSTVERETSVFLNTATLLWLLADTPERVKAISESPLSSRSFLTMYNTVNKKKMNNSSSNSSRLSSGQKLTTTTQMLPNPKPDWGLRHSRPRLFTSIHHAVVSLCKRLKIKPAQ